MTLEYLLRTMEALLVTLGTLGSTLPFWLHLGSLGGSLGGSWADLGAPGVHFNVPWASKTRPKWSRMPVGLHTEKQRKQYYFS